MADKQITEYTAVVTPADSDEFVVQQGGVTKKETRAQIVSTVTAAAAAAQSDADAAQTDATQALSDAAAAQTDIDNHIADAAAAHAASAISATADATKELSGTDVQAQINEVAARTISTFRYDDAEDAIFLADPFVTGGNTSGIIGNLGFTLVTSGAGAGASTPLISDSDAQGYVTLSTGTTNAGRAAIHLGTTQLNGPIVVSAKWRARLGQLTSAGVEEGTVYLGLHDSNGSADANDGMYFKYDPTDTTWHIVCAGGGTRSNVDTNVAADTSYHWFEIVSTGTAVHFYIDGTEVANSPITGANIPASGEIYGVAAAIVKSTGTTAWTLLVDDFALLLTR